MTGRHSRDASTGPAGRLLRAGDGTSPITAPEPGRLRALRRMKAVSAGLLVLAAVVYLLCHFLGHGKGVWGYVQAAAEASMVGGLADWFAVTALFRHPLGLPIPHTAIIPRKKDQIGSGLAGFVRENFLTPDIVGERVAQAAVPQRTGEWLADPEHARRVADELAGAVAGMAKVLRDDVLRNAVGSFADRWLREADAATVLSRLLTAVCESGQHQVALTGALRALMRFLDANRAVFRKRLAEESPDWVPDWVDDRVFARGFTAVQSFLADVSMSDDHELRRTFDSALRDYATALRTDPAAAARVEQAKLDLLDRPDIREYLASLWFSLKKLILDGANDPDSDLRRSVEALTIRTGELLRDDPGTIAKVEEALQRVTLHVVNRYADDITAVISTTVARWDTEETSRRLELQVGRDLQFIRINGTVVGALAGLVIYALTQLWS